MSNRKSRRTLIAFVSILAVTSCHTFLPLRLTPGRSAALPPGAAQMLRLCSRPMPAFDDSWKLEPAVVEQLERDLPRLRGLRARGCCFPGGRVADIDAYLRQYIGLVVDGRRYVYINAFPITSFEGWPATIAPVNWQRDPYDVCDGGSHWGVLYDVTTLRFSDLAFNGFS